LSDDQRRRISCGSPAFLGNELAYVNDALERGWITHGSYVARAEQLLEALIGTTYAVACSSGTSALHLALLGLELRAGDVVIVPALTYVATANAVRYCGGEPMFCDVYADTWTINPSSAAARARQVRESGRHVAGVLPVHLYGMPCDIGRLQAEPGLEDLWILEDAAQAIGAGGTIDVRGNVLNAGRCGSLGDVGILSFYGNKILTAGEGGAVLTNSERIAELAELYRGQGARTPGLYHHDVIGYNYRLTDLQAAVLCGQLETHQQHQQARRRLAQRYRELLEPHALELLELQVREIPGLHVDPVDWLMPVLLPIHRRAPNEISLREEAARKLDDAGIETRPFFMPLPFDSAHYTGETEDCYPVSADLYRRGLCLPLHAGLEEADVDYVCEQLLEAIR